MDVHHPRVGAAAAVVGADIVRGMAGPHRMPDALRRVDAPARGMTAPGAGFGTA